jgi:cytoskeletal protein RodZ
MITVAVAGVLLLIVHISNSRKPKPVKKHAETPAAAANPMPAASPTVAAPATSKTPASSHSSRGSSTKSGHSAPHENNDQPDNFQPKLRQELEKVVVLYASWPGTTSRKILLTRLQHEQPFITDGAVKKIALEWSNTPATFKVAIKGVVQASNLTALPNNPNSATTAVYLMLERNFTPASGKPYSQAGVQGYSVNMQIIDRQWHVVAIAPQTNG